MKVEFTPDKAPVYRETNKRLKQASGLDLYIRCICVSNEEFFRAGMTSDDLEGSCAGRGRSLGRQTTPATRAGAAFFPRRMCKINTALQLRENIPSGLSDASPSNLCTYLNVGVFNGVHSSGCGYIYIYFLFHTWACMCRDAAEMLLHLHHKGRRSEEDERWRRRQGGGVAAGGSGCGKRRAGGAWSGQRCSLQGAEQKRLQGEESAVTCSGGKAEEDGGREGRRCGPVHRDAADENERARERKRSCVGVCVFVLPACLRASVLVLRAVGLGLWGLRRRSQLRGRGEICIPPSSTFEASQA